METVLVDPDQSLIAYSRLTSSTPSPSRTISFSTRLKAAAPAAAGDGCRRGSGHSRNRCGPSPARLPVASAWPTNGLSVKGAHGGPVLLIRRLGPVIAQEIGIRILLKESVAFAVSSVIK